MLFAHWRELVKVVPQGEGYEVEKVWHALCHTLDADGWRDGCGGSIVAPHPSVNLSDASAARFLGKTQIAGLATVRPTPLQLLRWTECTTQNTMTHTYVRLCYAVCRIGQL